MALGDHGAMQVEIDRVDAALQRGHAVDDLADDMLEGLVGDMGAWLRGGPGDGMQRPFLLFRFGDEAADRDVHRLEGRVDRRALGQRRPALAADELVERRLLRRSEEHPSEIQSLMRISYVVFCFNNKNTTT